MTVLPCGPVYIQIKQYTEYNNNSILAPDLTNSVTYIYTYHDYGHWFLYKCLNTDSEGAFLMFNGNLFQSVGAAIWKLFLHMYVQESGMMRSWIEAARLGCNLTSESLIIWSLSDVGAMPCIHLNVSVFVRYSYRCEIFWSCNSFSRSLPLCCL